MGGKCERGQHADDAVCEHALSREPLQRRDLREVGLGVGFGFIPSIEMTITCGPCPPRGRSWNGNKAASTTTPMTAARIGRERADRFWLMTQYSSLQRRS
jgi:hypothetical protein